jgi:ATP-dependent exoDNAse (exonuclease V) alpha subunit
MINNELLEHMLVTLQHCSMKKAKVIISGDYHQLPPIIDNTLSEYRNVSSSIGIIYDLINADVMAVIDFVTRYRSENENYNEFLHDTRMGIIKDSTSIANYLAHYFNVYNDRNGIPSDIEKKLTFLEFVNAKVKYINDTMLEELPGAEHRIEYKVEEYKFPNDKSYMADDIINSFQMDKELVFKIGSKIVFRTNNHEMGYKNGDEGLITAFNGTEVSIDRFFGKEIIKMKIPRHEYSSSEKQRKSGYEIVVKQYPFSLIHSRTIHKAQGDEYQYLHLDFSFLENGLINNTMKWQLLYTAISRVSFPDGVWIHKNSINLLKNQFRLFNDVDHNHLSLNTNNKEIPYIKRLDN